MARLLAEVRSPVRRIRVAREVSIIWGLATLPFEGEAHSPDRPLAFIPNVTIVLLELEEKTQICAWKQQDPHCHVDPGTRLRV